MADPNFSGPPPPGGASSDGNPYKLAPGQAGGLPPPEVLAALPHDNAAMRLNTAIWVLNAVSFVFLALRVYCKSIRSRKLWWDDWILIMAWILLVTESSIISYLTTLGYGLHTWDFPFQNISRFVLGVTVTGTLSVTAAIWSKTSFAFTVWRLSDGWMRHLVLGLIISMNIAMGISALLPWVQCKPLAKAWDPLLPGKCIDGTATIYYNIFTGAYSAAMDVILSFLPWKLLWGLQMARKEKIGVIIAMSMGLIAAATAIVKCTKLMTMLSMDMYDNVDLFIWGNAEISVTIMAASVPILRALFREFHTSAKRTDPSMANREFSSKFYSKGSSTQDGSRSPPTTRSRIHEVDGSRSPPTTRSHIYEIDGSRSPPTTRSQVYEV